MFKPSDSNAISLPCSACRAWNHHSHLWAYWAKEDKRWRIPIHPVYHSNIWTFLLLHYGLYYYVDQKWSNEKNSLEEGQDEYLQKQGWNCRIDSLQIQALNLNRSISRSLIDLSNILQWRCDNIFFTIKSQAHSLPEQVWGQCILAYSSLHSYSLMNSHHSWEVT